MFLLFYFLTFIYIIKSTVLTPEYDYIVIGSGPGGGPVAARLALANYNVLVLEAGPDDLTFSSPNSSDFTPDYPYTQQTTMLDNTGFFMFGKPEINWANPTIPAETQSAFWNDSKLTGRIDTVSRAKILGGCSTHNLQAWNRGSIEDYDYMRESMKLNGWGWSDVLPHFMKMENYLGENKTLRGDSGPITVTPRVLRNWNEKNVKLIDAGIKHGLPLNNNWQAGSQRGIGLLDISHQPCDIDPQYCDGIAYGSWFKRQSSAEAYLRKLVKQYNKQSKLTILPDSIVEKIIFNSNKKAIGVRYYDKTGTANMAYINNKGEIIVSAGSYQSPQILMLSGIGPTSELNKYNITIIHESPKVGQNYSNHLYLAMVYEVNQTLYENAKTQPNSFSKDFGGINNDTLAVMQMFMKSGTFVLDNNDTDILDNGIFDDYNDIRIECWADGVNFAPNNITGEPDSKIEIDTVKSIVCYIDPQIYSSAGQILLKSNSIYDYPLIYPNYFYDDRDFRGFIWAIKELRKIFAEDQISFINETFPGFSTQTDAQLKDFILGESVDSAHPHGTLSMGNMEDDAVDSQCRVNGVEGVRVVDASIWPKGTNANPAALVFVISERCAQFIIDERGVNQESGAGVLKYGISFVIILMMIIVE